MSSFNETITRGSQSMLAIDKDLIRVEQLAKKNGHKPTSIARDRMFTINQQAKANLKVLSSLSNSSNSTLIYKVGNICFSPKQNIMIPFGLMAIAIGYDILDFDTGDIFDNGSVNINNTDITNDNNNTCRVLFTPLKPGGSNVKTLVNFDNDSISGIDHVDSNESKSSNDSQTPTSPERTKPKRSAFMNHLEDEVASMAQQDSNVGTCEVSNMTLKKAILDKVRMLANEFALVDMNNLNAMEKAGNEFFKFCRKHKIVATKNHLDSVSKCEPLTTYFFNTKCHKVFQENDNGMSGLPRMQENSPIDETLFIQGEGKKLASAVRNYIVNILLATPRIESIATADITAKLGLIMETGLIKRWNQLLLNENKAGSAKRTRMHNVPYSIHELLSYGVSSQLGDRKKYAQLHKNLMLYKDCRLTEKGTSEKYDIDINYISEGIDAKINEIIDAKSTIVKLDPTGPLPDLTAVREAMSQTVFTVENHETSQYLRTKDDSDEIDLTASYKAMLQDVIDRMTKCKQNVETALDKFEQSQLKYTSANQNALLSKDFTIKTLLQRINDSRSLLESCKLIDGDGLRNRSEVHAVVLDILFSNKANFSGPTKEAISTTYTDLNSNYEQIKQKAEAMCDKFTNLDVHGQRIDVMHPSLSRIAEICGYDQTDGFTSKSKKKLAKAKKAAEKALFDANVTDVDTGQDKIKTKVIARTMTYLRYALGSEIHNEWLNTKGRDTSKNNKSKYGFNVKSVENLNLSEIGVKGLRSLIESNLKLKNKKGHDAKMAKILNKQTTDNQLRSMFAELIIQVMLDSSNDPRNRNDFYQEKWRKATSHRGKK